VEVCTKPSRIISLSLGVLTYRQPKTPPKTPSSLLSLLKDLGNIYRI